MSISREQASKAALAAIRAMSKEALIETIKAKQNGTFAVAMREIAEFSDKEYSLSYRLQSAYAITGAHSSLYNTESNWESFGDLSNYEPANELLAA